MRSGMTASGSILTAPTKMESCWFLAAMPNKAIGHTGMLFKMDRYRLLLDVKPLARIVPDLTYTVTVLVSGNTYQAYNDPDGH